MDEFVNSLDSAAESRANNISSIESEYGGYQQLADTLYDLTEKQNKTAEDYDKINTLVSQL